MSFSWPKAPNPGKHKQGTKEHKQKKLKGSKDPTKQDSRRITLYRNLKLKHCGPCVGVGTANVRKKPKH